MDPEIFFMDDERTVHANPAAQAACNRCVILTGCLEWAMKYEKYGVWGGTTPKQRAMLKRPIVRLRCPGCASEAILEESASETCLSCGLSWKI